MESVPRKVTDTFPAASSRLSWAYWVVSMPMTTRRSMRNESPEAAVRARSGRAGVSRASTVPGVAASTGPSWVGRPPSTASAPRFSASRAQSMSLWLRTSVLGATSMSARRILPRTSPTRFQSSAVPAPTSTSGAVTGSRGGFADRTPRYVWISSGSLPARYALGIRSPLVEAPTAMTPSAAAGVLTVPLPGPSLPAAATTTTPARTAAVAARPSGSVPSPGPPRLMLMTSARWGLLGSAAASMPAMMSEV
ncbi:hypothetical protein STANM309S_00821 [Streptomyces tanashiensis]